MQINFNDAALFEVTSSCYLVWRGIKKVKGRGKRNPVLAPIATGSVAWPDHLHGRHLNLIHQCEIAITAGSWRPGKVHK